VQKVKKDVIGSDGGLWTGRRSCLSTQRAVD
jgi:hypothetical protein